MNRRTVRPTSPVPLDKHALALFKKAMREPGPINTLIVGESWPRAMGAIVIIRGGPLAEQLTGVLARAAAEAQMRLIEAAETPRATGVATAVADALNNTERPT